MADFQIINKTLKHLRFVINGDVVECYLTHDTLGPKDFCVVEVAGPLAEQCVIMHFDDLDMARAAYDAAAVRTKARILEALT